ncbi:MAG TPA: tetratricopeptide repeat protein [Thermoanaerobaculia bacterium]|nr:tetratricopeptide repeat protein [Thermoanaerobaculia bacterium]
MRQPHLTLEALGRLARGGEPAGRVVVELFRHLLSICPECRQAWRESAMPALGRSKGRYRGVVARAVQSVRLRGADLERERREAPDLVRELIQGTEAEQIARFELDARFRTWGVCDLLINESHQAAFEDPLTAEALAGLAINLAERLEPEAYGPAFLCDVRAMAWAYLGNARRVSSDLRGAADAIRHAEQLLELGTGDPLCRAHVLSLKASLLRAQRRFEESQQLLEEVVEIYRRAADSHLVGLTLVQKATGYRYQGMTAGAIALLERALPLIDAGRDPRLALCARHNLAECFIETGRLDRAEASLAAIREEYPRAGGHLDRLMLSWLEGRLAAARGELEKAEAALTETRAGFIERQIGYDAALVSLDLACLFAERGELGRVKELALEMLPIFRSRDVHREALAALAIFQQAALGESLSVVVVKSVAAYLRRARRDPSLRFES